MDPGVWSNDSSTLHPLPGSLQRGLLAIFVLASLSFMFAFGLFVYLTYKLLSWRFGIRRQQDKEFERRHRGQAVEEGKAGRAHQQQREKDHDDDDSSQTHAQNFVLGIDGVFTDENPDDGVPHSRCCRQRRGPSVKPVKSAPNQFLILIYNLLLADLHQSMAFMFNGRWLHSNGIIVGDPVCFTQGLFVSTGDLSSSFFILCIAIHTYLSVVRGYQPPQRFVYGAVVFGWAFVYLSAVIPIAATRNGAMTGGFFVRAVSWCWINKAYERTRLLTHYLWIFIALVTTSVLYISIWLHLRRQARARGTAEAQTGPNYNPAFLVYPVIYVMCTLPLATGRLLTMVDVELPIEYFCFAGAMISVNGFFDCILFGTTRHAIIFASRYHLDDGETGVATIAFLQTPKSRVYGNMVWIGGGSGGRRKAHNDNDDATSAGGWWSWQRLTGRIRNADGKHNRGSSQESLRGIQMDMVTTVVVEVDDGAKSCDYPCRSKLESANMSGASVAGNEAQQHVHACVDASRLGG